METTRKRRWWRFSLAALLIAMLVSAVFFAALKSGLDFGRQRLQPEKATKEALKEAEMERAAHLPDDNE